MYINFWNFMEGDYPKRFEKSNFLNDWNLFISFLYNLNMVMSSIKVEGLPVSCNERFLKLCYITRGQVCMYNSPEFGLITPMAGIGGMLNLYGEPSTVTLSVFGSDPETLKLSGRQVEVYMEGSDNVNAPAVWQRANNSMLPYIFIIMQYSEMMADTLGAIRVAAKTLKIPWILTCPPEMKKTLDDIVDDIDENATAIVGVDLTRANASELFKTNADPGILKALWEHYRNLQSELREKIGIKNQENTDKQERLLVDEVNANNEATELEGLSFIGGLKAFCEKCNKVFGLSLTADWTIKKENENENREIEDFK